MNKFQKVISLTMATALLASSAIPSVVFADTDSDAISYRTSAQSYSKDPSKVRVVISIGSDESITEKDIALEDGVKMESFNPKGGGVYVVEVRRDSQNASDGLNLQIKNDEKNFLPKNQGTIIPTIKEEKPRYHPHAYQKVVSTTKREQKETLTMSESDSKNTVTSALGRESRAQESTTSRVTPAKEIKKEMPEVSRKPQNSGTAPTSVQNAVSNGAQNTVLQQGSKANGKNDTAVQGNVSEIENMQVKTDDKNAEQVTTKLTIGKNTYVALVEGVEVEKTMDVAPRIHQGRTVLPARAISELLGVEVKYENTTKTANFILGENKVELKPGQKFMTVNGEQMMLTSEIIQVDGRVLLPLTDIQKAFENLGLRADVTWDAESKSVSITK
ncbi:MAG: copper amine oxidase N-terminal domain-containing protein [Peptostreptococcaceae bacterium]|nr:copper amine oxidase N-terminal domain-containing protein [Peptostreptococcaceae bacterium]